MIYGDVKEFSLLLQGGDNPAVAADYSATSTVDQVQWIFGEDQIQSGVGNDIIYGDVESMLIQLETGLNPEGVYQSTNARLEASLFLFGNDQISSDGGQDLLVGDFGSLLFEFTQKDGLPLLFVNNTIVLGNDLLVASGTEGSQLYGDYMSFESELSGAPIVFYQLFGGNDTLVGSDGNDLLAGNFGNDILTGNAGQDTFKFEQNIRGVFEMDRITDYEVGVDLIDISDYGLNDENDLFSVTDNGIDTTVNINGIHQVVFEDMLLTASDIDFIF